MATNLLYMFIYDNFFFPLNTLITLNKMLLEYFRCSTICHYKNALNVFLTFVNWSHYGFDKMFEISHVHACNANCTTCCLSPLGNVLCLCKFGFTLHLPQQSLTHVLACIET
jgi:hypothetical protein